VVAFPRLDDDDVLNRAEWVRLMWDYDSDGIWDIDGRGCSVDDLPIPQHLRRMILGWAAWSDFPPGSGPESDWFDHKAHSAFGWFIARLLKRALPDWSVVYFDNQDPSPDREPGRPRGEYEITAAMAGLSRL
jgi:hypothetical protein